MKKLLKPLALVLMIAVPFTLVFLYVVQTRYTRVEKKMGPGNWKWNRKVTLVCPWGLGGGADATLRHLAPVLEKILKVPVEVVNVEGEGGAKGMNFVYWQPPDGYTYVLGTQSIIMLDLQRILPFRFRKEMKPVAKLAQAVNVLISSKAAMEGQYRDFKGLIRFALDRPDELSCGMISATGVDSVALKQTLSLGLGCSIPEVDNYITTVGYTNGLDLDADLVAGRIDLAVTGAQELKGLAGITPLATLSRTRLPAFPDRPSTGELGINSYVGTWRVLYCRSATPQKAVDAMYQAVFQAWNNPAYQDFLKSVISFDSGGISTPKKINRLMDREYQAFGAYLRTAGL
jgi:tripartite-type tricarboxylate transporter receptor subunit TctC